MENFFKTDFKISEIAFVFYVSPGRRRREIKNRSSHGFLYNCGAPRKHIFDNGNAVSLKKGDIIYLPKNSSYTIETEMPGNCYIINFELLGETDISEFALTPKNTADILNHFENAENMWKTRRTGYYEKCFAELYDIIYKLKKDMTAAYMPKSRENLIKPALKYIDENFTEENINIARLAMLCGISEQYLRQIFRSIYGVSPLKYINNLKIARAKELIKYGSYSIREAAEFSGFFNDSYFSREFKKSTGVSPTEYFRGEE